MKKEQILIDYLSKYCTTADGVVCDYRSRHLAVKVSQALNLPFFSLEEAKHLNNPIQVIEFCTISTPLIERGYIVAAKIEERMKRARFPYIYSPESV